VAQGIGPEFKPQYQERRKEGKEGREGRKKGRKEGERSKKTEYPRIIESLQNI
jgi:hypothetical protein